MMRGLNRRTINHNQDKVSMGTIAARGLRDINELTRSVLAIHLLALCQALDLRGVETAAPASRAVHALIRTRAPFVDQRWVKHQIVDLVLEVDEAFMIAKCISTLAVVPQGRRISRASATLDCGAPSPVGSPSGSDTR